MTILADSKLHYEVFSGKVEHALLSWDREWLFDAKIEQSFARDMNLLTLGHHLHGCASTGAHARANRGSLATASNRTDYRASDCADSYFLRSV